MSVKIRNLSKKLLIVPLNSGKTIQLGPGETSQPVEDREVNGNQKLSQFVQSSLIATIQAEPPHPGKVTNRRP